MEWKWITTLEDLETILYDITNFTPYECYSIKRERNCSYRKVIEACIRVEETLYSIYLHYEEDWRMSGEDRVYSIGPRVCDIRHLLGADIYMGYFVRIKDVLNDLKYNHKKTLEKYADQYSVDPESIESYFGMYEFCKNDCYMDVDKIKEIDRKRKERIELNTFSTAEGVNTIHESVKITFSVRPEYNDNKKVFDFIQVELPIYKMDLHDPEQMKKVKAYVVERIEKNIKFRKFGVPVNILRCYSITRENEFFTFRFEIKKVKRSK